MTQDKQPHATDGIFALSGQKDILALDLSSVLWKDVLGTEVDPIDATNFQHVYFSQVAGKSIEEIGKVLDELLAQAAASGATWRIEQTWSPSDRAQALNYRDEAPYLMRVENGRAICLRRGKATGSGRKSWSGRSRACCQAGPLEVRRLAA